MHYQIKHQTIYTYDRLVYFQPHLLRLRPRSDSWQQLKSFSLTIFPSPESISEFNDLDDNNLIKIWFDREKKYQELIINIEAEVETYKTNPFDYLLEPWALNLPFDYPSSLLTQLQPYLQPIGTFIDPVALALAQEIHQEVDGNVVSFLSTLNHRIHTTCKYIVREKGEPWFPKFTWQEKQGSCRDLTVLFMEVCRALGLATRFVSGYNEGDLDIPEKDLHAWVQVYLPGAGWRGYDPTYNLVVSNRYVALVASAIPRFTSPIVGAVTPAGAIANMEFKLNIDRK